MSTQHPRANNVFNWGKIPFETAKMLIAICFCCVAAEAQDRRSALEYFSQSDQYMDADMSPGGDDYAIWRMKGANPVVEVMGLTSANDEVSRAFELPPSLFNWFQWIDDKRLLISVTQIDAESAVLKAKRTKKGAAGLRRLFYIADNGTSDLNLVTSVPLESGVANGSDDFLHRLPDEPNHVLIAFPPDGGEHPGVYKLNVNTGEKIEIEPPTKPFVSWLADRDGNVRLASGWGDDQLEVKVKATFNSKWESLSNNALFKDGRFGIIGFSDDGNNLYVRSSFGKGRSVIYRFDMKKRAVRQKIFEHPIYDAGSLVFDNEGKSVLAATYVSDTVQFEVFDDVYATYRKNLRDHIGADHFYTLDRNSEKSVSLVHVADINAPGRLILYDEENNVFRELMTEKKGSPPIPFSTPKAVKYFSRDGLEIPGYLTLPKNYWGQKIPMIIMPHGGPWVRDILAYDDWAQYFVNIGYGVLQPNFRGSTGYGNSFEVQGYGEWGRAMQDDLTDGANWLIAEGYTSKERICMVGASYGGYASLMSVIRSPENFQCAVSIAPVTDLALWINSISASKAERNALMYRTVGASRSKDLKKRSPAFLAKKIKRPILLVHGGADIRVPPEHSRRMEKVLKKYKKSFDSIWLDGGSHFFLQSAHKKKVFEESTAFLKVHIGNNPQ